MTSNVSISSTITTRTHGTALLSPSQHHQAPRFHHQALEVRITIASVATLLDQLSTLLLEDKLPTRKIKRAYLDMQVLDASCLKCVLESFEMSQPETIIELLSGSASQDEDMIPGVPSVFSSGAFALDGQLPAPDANQTALDQFFSPVLRSKSENHPADGKDAAVDLVSLCGRGVEDAKVVRPREGGRHRGSRRDPSKRPSLTLQDPLNLS
jgi:hypothetical protein